VDVDRFGATTAVTLVADAVPVFVAALAAGRSAAVLRVLPGADLWSPALLGPARRRELGGGERASEVAAAFFRQRMRDQLAQLPRRAALPPHVRQALQAHVEGLLARGPGGAPAAAPDLGTDVRLPGGSRRTRARPTGVAPLRLDAV